jgi:hypothetical protein
MSLSASSSSAISCSAGSHFSFAAILLSCTWKE